jgi:hypothetical protein
VGLGNNSFLILSEDKMMALIMGAKFFARVLFPTPGRPHIITINCGYRVFNLSIDIYLILS